MQFYYLCLRLEFELDKSFAKNLKKGNEKEKFYNTNQIAMHQTLEEVRNNLGFTYLDFLEMVPQCSNKNRKITMDFSGFGYTKGYKAVSEELKRSICQFIGKKIPASTVGIGLTVQPEDKMKAFLDEHNISVDKVFPEETGNVEPAVSPEKRLNDLIGLQDVKRVIHQLVANNKVNVMRSKESLKVAKDTMHMIFTGNPGSAKTTVARLVGELLAKEGVIRTHKFVEVGRADVVGKYVGSTAPLVKENFQQAKGGILFIDEAYALVGEGQDYGAEAINTIVQEMENHRDEVVVIFAGYPEKMEEFLQQNEGLRSRINYHLKFPDYSPNELMEILEKQAQEREYEIAEGAREVCILNFERAKAKIGFGNGRYARNMLEKAISKQALRLVEQGHDPDRKELMLLKAEDFDVEEEPKQRHRLGIRPY